MRIGVKSTLSVLILGLVKSRVLRKAVDVSAIDAVLIQFWKQGLKSVVKVFDGTGTVNPGCVVFSGQDFNRFTCDSYKVINDPLRLVRHGTRRGGHYLRVSAITIIIYCLPYGYTGPDTGAARAGRPF